MPMRCPRCGAENPEGKILCRACGARLRPAAAGAAQGAPPAQTSDEELRRRVAYDLIRIVWVIAVVVAAGLGLGLVFK
jgi:uncharacterized membrane protein YvbJ